MTDRELLQLADQTLTRDERHVWLLVMAGVGRIEGGRLLGISENAFRWRSARADRKLKEASRSVRSEAAILLAEE